MSRSLAGFAVTLVIVVVAAVVIRKIQVRSMLEDCMLSQQPACELALDRLRISRMVDRVWQR